MRTATFPLSFFNKVYQQFAPYFEDDNDIHFDPTGIFIQAILPPSPQLEEEEVIFSEGEEMRMFVAHFSECTIVGWCRGDLREERVADILKDFTAQRLCNSSRYEQEKEALRLWNCDLFLGKNK